MGKSGRWFGIGPKRFPRSSPQETVIIVHTNTTSFSEEIASKENSAHKSRKEGLSREDVAAIKIQAFFRGHLARRAFKALKSLVKLQAVVRGVCVRKQARIAMQCMHALARLQMTIRARQLVIGT